ncbi:hypothetical protein [Botrimarina sp.]|uniref:hypothetical protein n=1 Tax=Botrimarina sp. TaxID=2795802 RepID=UPI0032ED0FCE
MLAIARNRRHLIARLLVAALVAVLVTPAGAWETCCCQPASQPPGSLQSQAAEPAASQGGGCPHRSEAAACSSSGAAAAAESDACGQPLSNGCGCEGCPVASPTPPRQAAPVDHPQPVATAAAPPVLLTAEAPYYKHSPPLPAAFALRDFQALFCRWVI